MGELLDRIYQYGIYVLLMMVLVVNGVISLLLNDVRYYLYSKKIRRNFYGNRKSVSRFSRRKN